MSRTLIPQILTGPSVFDDDPPDWWPGDGSLGNTIADLTPEQHAEWLAYQTLQSNYRRRTFSMFFAAIFG